MGKTAVSEENDRYGGVSHRYTPYRYSLYPLSPPSQIYVGTLTHEEIKDKVEKARLIISIGALKSDFNTGNFTYRIPPESTIELHSTHVKVRHAVFPNINMKGLLPKLTAHLEPCKPNAERIPVPRFRAVVPEEPTQDITHDWLWPRVGQFFRSKDVIVAETGMFEFKFTLLNSLFQTLYFQKELPALAYSIYPSPKALSSSLRSSGAASDGQSVRILLTTLSSHLLKLPFFRKHAWRRLSRT